jgi:hypothetical protein|nr:MAG TPA: hypothetical protein [Caudoviricetes sp.]
MANLIKVISRVDLEPLVPVDLWEPRPDQLIFKEQKGLIIAPIAWFIGRPPGNPFEYFSMTPKKCYNGQTKIKEDGTRSVCFREHCCKYLNYFENFYDRDKILLGFYAQAKFFMEAKKEEYSVPIFINELYRHVISFESSPILHYAITRMNEDNYNQMTALYKNTKNPCLEYKDVHAKILMEASLIQCLIIPLVSHYMYINKILNSIEVKDFLLACFNPIYDMLYRKYNVDLKNKLYETVITNIGKNRTHNPKLWDMQAIRGINPTIHAINTVENLIIQIVPKYKYSENIVSFNSNVIQNEIKYKVTEIPYEFELIQKSSSNRDDDNNSETDRFEAHMTKQNESLAMHLRVSCMKQMERIEQTYGPFSEAEINFYIQELSKGDRQVKNVFQSELIFYLFMDEFGDTNSIKFVNVREYIILMLAAKRKLQLNNLFLLAEIIGGRVEKPVARKTVNKNIMLRMKMSENYQRVLNNYANEEILENTLFGFIAKCIASEFTIIDFYDRRLHGQVIEVNKDLIAEQFLSYALMI